MTSKVKGEGVTRERQGRSDVAPRPSPQIQVPDPVRELIRKLEDGGFETWTVGGGVRDALRGRPSEGLEWDLATRATPRQVRRLFKRTVPLGMEYGTVGVFGSDGRLYEVTTFRHDVITYGRKAKVAFAETLDEDLARRDFTVNAMAWHPRRNELRDRNGGRDDLHNRILRAVGSPAERFREDYLRVLRGLRFAGALEMEIDSDTWDGMVEAVPGLSRLSMERVREELEKVLSRPRPSQALELYRRSGALAQILPELREGVSAEAMATVDSLDQGDWLLRMAALLLFGMEPGDATPGRVADLLTRLRLSNADAERIVALARGGLAPPAGIARDPVARRRWVADMTRAGVSTVPDIQRIWNAVAQAAPTRTNPIAVDRLAADIQRDHAAGIPTRVGDLPVAGRDLVAQGWLPGPGIGAALRSFMEAVWEDPTLNDRAILLERVAAMKPPR